MTYTVRNLVALCLLALPTVALANEYQLNGPPDISIDGMTFTDNSTYATFSGGIVETLIDTSGTGCFNPACEVSSVSSLPFVRMTVDQTGFKIYNDSDPTQVYLSGSFLSGSYKKDGSEVGEIFLVESDDHAFWDHVESTDAGLAHTVSAFNLSVGAEMVLDVHNAINGEYGAYADMTPIEPPTVTPEPATLTLLGSGMLAGLLRKRFAGKKK